MSAVASVPQRVTHTGHLVDFNLLDKFMLPEGQRQIELDKNFLSILARENQDVPVQYFVDFLYKAQLTGADPRRSEIYLIPYAHRQQVNGQWVETKKANVVFAYQFFLSRAYSTGTIEHWEVNTHIEDYVNPFAPKMNQQGLIIPEKVPVSVAQVWIKGREKSIVYRARLPEFVAIGKNGPNKNWLTKPYLMLEKCALCNVMRQAFPGIMSGMYTSEEITGDELRVVSEAVPASAPIQIDPMQVTPVEVSATVNGTDVAKVARTRAPRQKPAAPPMPPVQAAAPVAPPVQSAPVPPMAAPMPPQMPPQQGGITQAHSAKVWLNREIARVVGLGGMPMRILGVNPHNLVEENDAAKMEAAAEKLAAWTGGDPQAKNAVPTPPPAPRIAPNDSVPDDSHFEVPDDMADAFEEDEPPEQETILANSNSKFELLAAVQDGVQRGLIQVSGASKLTAKLLSDAQQCAVLVGKIKAGDYSYFN